MIIQPDHKRFFNLEELNDQPKPVWMIEGMFQANTITMVVAPPASFKSFLVTDWGLSIAAGRKWNSRATAHLPVLYCLGEGRANLPKRIAAWTNYFQPDAEQRESLLKNFRVTFDVPQLALKPSVDNLLADLSKENFNPSLIIIDTFARSFVGLDENSQKDTGLWIEQADRLRQNGATVIFVHHSAKNTEMGVKYRGASAIKGAVDTELVMVRESSKSDRVKLSIEKQKDQDEGPPMNFARLPIGAGDEGSMVLVPSTIVDERFSEEHFAIERCVRALLETPFESDAARARELARQFDLTEDAAKQRISRIKRDLTDLVPSARPSLPDRPNLIGV